MNEADRNCIKTESPKKLFGSFGCRYLDLCAGILLCIFNLFWFLPFMESGIIMGDDLGVAIAVDWPLSMAFMPTAKFRPIYNFFYILTAYAFDNVYGLYFWFNLIINALISVLLYFLIQKVTGKQRFTSFVFCLLYIMSPFSYYNILQLLGFMEALCILFLLVIFYFAVCYLEGKRRAIYPAVVFAILITFVHERYIVLSPWLLIVALCGQETFRSRLLKAAATMLPLLINIILKKFVLQSDVLVGTGGTSIAFDLGTILTFFGSGLLSIFGVNKGPEYLVGYGYLQFTEQLKNLSVFFVILSFALLFVYLLQNVILTRDNTARVKELKLLLVAAAAIGALLLSGCITIRLEQRWLTAPFVAYLIYFAYIVSKIRFKFAFVLRKAVLILLLICAFTIFDAQHSGVGHLYFSRAMRIAQNFYDASIFRYGESLSDYTVYIIGNNEMQWAVGHEGLSMFDIYLDNDVDFKYVSSVEEVNQDYASTEEDQKKPVKIFRMEGNLQVSEVPSTTIGMNISSTLTSYENQVSPDAPADTPSGTGVFSDGGTGFTVLSGYCNTIQDVEIPEEAMLYLEFGMPYEISDGAFVTVTLTSDGMTFDLIAFPVYYSDGVSEAMLVEIGNDVSMSGDISIRVTSPSGDAVADWVTFTGAGIYTESQ